VRAHLFAGALAALGVLVVPADAEPVEVTDDSGTVLALSAPARRVVTLAPHLTELLYAAGGAARLVGVDSYSRYPATVATLPRVGDAAGLDLERILALRPELAFGWLSGNKASDLARLRQLGVPLFLSEPRHLADVPRTLRIIGKLLGTSATAEQQARAFEAKLQALQVHAAGPRTVSVFFEVWHQPLSSVNGEHLISDVIALCGGRNIFAGLAALAPPVTLESVLVADPEVIVATDVPPGALSMWDRYPRLRAVQRKQVYQLEPDLIARAAPRILDGAEKMCEWLRRAREAQP
jgi:iron complex transport system substrate-binding protein